MRCGWSRGFRWRCSTSLPDCRPRRGPRNPPKPRAPAHASPTATTRSPPGGAPRLPPTAVGPCADARQPAPAPSSPPTDARTRAPAGAEVGFGRGFGDREGRLAHARADLEHQGRLTLRSYGSAGKGDAVLGVELIEGALLGRGGATLAKNETANRPQAALEEIFPSVGELGAAE